MEYGSCPVHDTVHELATPIFKVYDALFEWQELINDARHKDLPLLVETPQDYTTRIRGGGEVRTHSRDHHTLGTGKRRAPCTTDSTVMCTRIVP